MFKYFLNWGKVAVAIASLLVFSHAYSITGENKFQFKSIGRADGKTYFLDVENNVKNWTEARNYCKEYGYQLPTIETLFQSALINIALRENGRNREIWINAKEKETRIPLAWIPTSSDLTDDLFPGAVYQQVLPRSSDLQCAVIYYDPRGLRASCRPCTETRYILCQSDK